MTTRTSNTAYATYGHPHRPLRQPFDAPCVEYGPAMSDTRCGKAVPSATAASSGQEQWAERHRCCRCGRLASWCVAVHCRSGVSGAGRLCDRARGWRVDFRPRAFRTIWHGRLGAGMLMTIATIGAVLLGESGRRRGRSRATAVSGGRAGDPSHPQRASLPARPSGPIRRWSWARARIGMSSTGQVRSPVRGEAPPPTSMRAASEWSRLAALSARDAPSAFLVSACDEDRCRILNARGYSGAGGGRCGLAAGWGKWS